MKRKSIAMAMALAMVLSAAPVNMAGAAEDDILMEEIVAEEPMEVAEVPVETAGEETTATAESAAAEMEEGESAGTAEEEEIPAGESATSSEETAEITMAGGNILESIEVVGEGSVDAIQMGAEGEATDEPTVLSDWGLVTVPAAVETETDLTPGVVTFQLPAISEEGLIVVEKVDGVTATLLTNENTTGDYIVGWDEEDAKDYRFVIWEEEGDFEQEFYLKLENTNSEAQTCLVRLISDSHLIVPEGKEYSVDRGGSIELSALSTQTGDGFGEIRYQWYQYQYDEERDGYVSIPISDATEATYTVLNVQEYQEYYCEVSDDYDMRECWFCVDRKHVDTHFDLDSTMMPANGRLYVESGQSILLSVNATSDLGAGAIRYQWSSADGDILGATGPTYQTPALTKYARYDCEVTDGENGAYYGFSIYVANPAAETLTGDMTVTAIIPEHNVLMYKIIPARTARYALYSTSDMDTYGTLLDENKNMLTYDDDGDTAEDSNNFRVEYTLTAGKTYYLVAGFWDKDDFGSYQVTMATTCAHTPARYVSRVEPTCAVNGSCVAVCASCGEEYEDVLPATGQHSYGNWSVAQAPTVFADGVQVRTCTVCGAQETAPIAKLAPTMTVNASSLPLKAGQSTTKLKVTDLAAGDSIVSWTSSNPKVVKVDAAGKITAQKKAGGKKATVTVTLASGLTQNITVKVQKSAVKTSKISVETKKLTLEKGAKYSVVPMITPITTLDKVSYSSSNKKVATVSKKGVITAKKSGKAKITVKSGKKKITITVTVPKTQPTAITNIPAAKTLKKGKSTTLKAKLAPASAEAKITYKSSNKKVATVNAKGKVTAKKKGTAVITVKAGSIVTTCTITVK